MSGDASGTLAGWPLALRVHPRARRLSLRVAARGDGFVLTLPRGASRRAAIGWAQAQKEWAGRQAARLGGDRLGEGAVLPLRGVDLLIRHDPAAPRRPVVAGDALVVGGPAEALEARLLRWLRGEALADLTAEVGRVAAQAGVSVAGVRLSDAGTRWGSCSAAGMLRFQWRLVMAPPAALRFVVAHEVAHRVHMDHGAAFHALEARLYDGDVGDARGLLRAWSARMRRIGRG